MDVQLGLFDTFTYALPGAAYLAVGAYAAVRQGWIVGARWHGLRLLRWAHVISPARIFWRPDADGLLAAT